MRRWLGLIACVAVAGCGVSKNLYQEQVVLTQELQARVADLEARLATETGRRETLEKVLVERKQEVGGLLGKHDQAIVRTADLEARLASSSQREDTLRADLDLCRKAKAATGSELEKSEREKADRVRELEACRGQVSDLRTENAALRQEIEKTERQKREKLDEVSKTYEGLVEGLKDEMVKGRLTISQVQGKLSVSVLDDILFDSGSATVKPEGRQVLDRVGRVLKDMRERAISIEGHTDNVPITGDLEKRFPSNWELSTARASSVTRYLQETVGVDPERLSAVGFGAFRPANPNDTLEGRRRNRRIEIRLVPLDTVVPAPSEQGKEKTGAGPESR